MDRLRPTGKARPPFVVDHFSWLDRSDQNGPFHLTFPTHSQSQSVLSMYNMEENTNHCSFYGVLTVDLSLLLVRPCAETTVTVMELCYGCLERSFSRENFECSFRHSKLVFEDLWTTQNNPLYWFNLHETARTILIKCASGIMERHLPYPPDPFTPQKCRNLRQEILVESRSRCPALIETPDHKHRPTTIV